MVFLVIYCNNNTEEWQWVLHQQQCKFCQCLSVRARLDGSSTMQSKMPILWAP